MILTLQLLDNIIFPGVLEKEKQSEVEFYAQRGIEMKPEFAEKEKKKEEGPPTRSRNTSTYNSVSTRKKTLALMPYDRPFSRYVSRFG